MTCIIAIIFLVGCLVFMIFGERSDRRYTTGGLHDRLDVLMGMRCFHCDKHIGGGALHLPANLVCECRGE